MLLRAILVLPLLTCSVCAHRILLLPISVQSSSRLLEMRRYGSVIREGGHDVTFLTTRTLAPFFEGKNFTVITFESDSELIPHLAWSKFYLSEFTPYMEWQLLQTFMNLMEGECEAILADKEAHQKIKTANFDLLVYDALQTCAGFVDTIMEFPPKITIFPLHLALPSKAVIPHLPSHIPEPNSKRTHSMSFLDRVYNFHEMLMKWIMIDLILIDPMNRRLEASYHISMNWDHIIESLHLVLHNPFFDFPRSLPPSVIPVGGMLVGKPNPLPDILSDFMEKSGEHGVVVVSFGTLTHGLDARSEIMARALSRLPHKVIWKFNTTTKPEALGSNTLIVDWIPQNDLFAHHKIKAFVSHCGIKSTHEALYNGIPVLAVPFHSDQFQNALKITQRSRSGIQYDFHSLTEDSFFTAVSMVAESKELRENARSFAEVFRRSASSMKEQVLLHIDHLVESGSASHLITPAIKELNTFQLYLIDVILFDTALLLLAFFSFIRVLRKLLSCIQGKKKVE